MRRTLERYNESGNKKQYNKINEKREKFKYTAIKRFSSCNQFFDEKSDNYPFPV